MNALSLFRTLGKNDFKLVRRDKMLCLCAALSFVYALMLRWAVPPITRALAGKFDLTPYYPLLVSYLLLCVPPLLFGMVLAFLLLDERDDDILSALRVTPIPMRFFLFYRFSIPVVVSVMITMIVIPIPQLTATPPLRLFLIALLASTEAPVIALLMAGIAKNKVQGLAMGKAIGTILVLPVLAYFIPSGWQLLLGLSPNYWPMKLFWISAGNEPGFLYYYLAGAAYHAVLNVFVIRFYLKRTIRALD